MIKTLTISNFQSHKTSTVAFAPTVTAFTGLNNHGKSAIFRALKKLVRNEPEGASFIRDGEAVCEITLETDASKVVRRIRSDGASDANMYIVDGTEFAKFGKSGIPEEALVAIGISPIQEFGSDVQYDLNFQDQFDLLFLVQGAGLPSIRGKVLGRITGVDIVQRGIQNGAAAERRLAQEEKRCTADMEKISAQMQHYAPLDKLLCEAADAGQGFDDVMVLQGTVEMLGGYLDNVLVLLKHAQQLSDEVKLLRQVDGIDIAAMLKEAERFGQLNQLSGQLECKAMRYLALDAYLAVPFDVDMDGMRQAHTTVCAITQAVWLESRVQELEAEISYDIPDLQELEKHTKRYAEFRELERSLWFKNVEVIEKMANLQNATALEQIAIEELEEFKQKTGVCPLCERPFENHEEHSV